MTATPTVRPTWRHWGALVMLGLPLFMMATDFTAIFLAVPAIGADLGPSATQMLWLVHIGELVAAGTLITMGWLTGRIGPRTLLLISLALYGVAAALAAYAPNAEVLLTARVLIGVATAALGPAAFALLRSLFSSARHYGIGFAVVMGAFPAGTALGPPLTGALLEYFWWGSVFLINVPIAAVALTGGLLLFPGPSEKTTDRIDIISVVISMTAVMLAVFGLQEIADQGFTLTYALAIGAGLLLGSWFIRRQRRIVNPLLDLNLFAIRVLRTLAIYFVLVHVAFVAGDFVLIQYLQIVAGIPTASLGIILAVPGIAAIIATALTPMATARFTPSTVTAMGIGTGVFGTLLILIALIFVPMTALFAAGMTIVSFAMSPLMVLAAQLMITSVPRHQAGPAAAIQDIAASLGAAAGITVLGSLSMAVFSREMTAGASAALSPAEMEAATDSLGGAVAVAEETGGVTGTELLSLIHDAWSSGTVATYVAGLLVAVAMMVFTVRRLRGVRLPSDEEPEGQAREPDPDSLDEVPVAVPAESGLPGELEGDVLERDALDGGQSQLRESQR